MRLTCGNLAKTRELIRSLGDEEGADPKERVVAECQEERVVAECQEEIAMSERSHTLR